MRKYVENLTNNLIGKNRFDEMAERYRRDISIRYWSRDFRDQVQLELLVNDVKDMSPETLGRILCSLEIEDVSSHHLGKEVCFGDDCEEMLRNLVARALAYVITDRLDPERPNNVPPYTKKKQEVSGRDEVVSVGLVKGFVYRQRANGVWEVLVEDPSCEHDGEAFDVEPGVAILDRLGVYVTFRIKAVQVGGQKILKAFDLRFSPGI